MRDKFAREALMDLPATATPKEREDAERAAKLARQEHARAALALVKVRQKRLQYTELSHNGKRAARLIPRLEAIMRRAS
jgi:hypothetical protein